MIHPPQWTTDAACVGSNPGAWFVGQGQASHVTKLRALCARCPVRDECLALAMDAERGTGINRRHGIYGGLTPRERLRLASKRREEGAA